jgi:hypothetical protein
MGLPSALFALGHCLPASFGPDAPLVSLWASAEPAARTGTPGAAPGFHSANTLTVSWLAARLALRV